MANVERLQKTIRTLVAQRQALRESDADPDRLESNRLELTLRQRQLYRTLIERYLRQAERDAA